MIVSIVEYSRDSEFCQFGFIGIGLALCFSVGYSITVYLYLLMVYLSNDQLTCRLLRLHLVTSVGRVAGQVQVELLVDVGGAGMAAGHVELVIRSKRVPTQDSSQQIFQVSGSQLFKLGGFCRTKYKLGTSNCLTA